MRRLPPQTIEEISADDSIEPAPEWGMYGDPQPEDVLEAVDKLLQPHGLEIVQVEDANAPRGGRIFLKVEKRLPR